MSRVTSNSCPGKEKGKRRGISEDDGGGQELESIEEKESGWRFGGGGDRVL